MGCVGGGGGGDRPLPPRKDGWETVTDWTTCTPFSREKSAFGVTLLNLALERLTTWLEAAATVGIVSRGFLLLRARDEIGMSPTHLTMSLLAAVSRVVSRCVSGNRNFAEVSAGKSRHA